MEQDTPKQIKANILLETAHRSTFFPLDKHNSEEGNKD